MPVSETIPFGALLKELRKRAGMTQRDLAAALNYSDSLISNLELGQRLPDVNAVVTRFIPALGLQDEPVMAFSLIERAAAARGERLRDLPQAFVNGEWSKRNAMDEREDEIPTRLRLPLTALIGRSEEVDHLCNRLLGHGGRLLTLVGPPGIGKTTLALAVAEQLQHHYADGALFVALAEITDAGMMASTIMTKLGWNDNSPKPPLTMVIESLRRKSMLLLLDNCEQIGNAALVVAEILTCCPGIVVLATSRERLHLRAEQRYRAPPLTLAYAAELFSQRATAINHEFLLTEVNRPTVEAICEKLDRLPLALELCAAQLDFLSPAQLLEQLQKRRLDLLVDGAHDLPPQHRTLRHAIRRSYDLLSIEQRRLFRILGVFVGGFALPEFEALATWEMATSAGNSDESSSALSELHALVSKSLVRVDTLSSGEQRYSQLETIREFAVEQLDQHGETDVLRHGHALHYLRLAEATAVAYNQMYRDKWIRELLRPIEVDYDNMRAALGWVAVNSAEMELRLLSALSGFWIRRSYLSEGRHWLEELATQRTPAPSPVYAKLLTELGVLCWRQGDFVTAQARLEESISLSRTLQDRLGLGVALHYLASVMCSCADYAAARILAEESVVTLRTQEAPKALGFALDTLAEAMLMTGDSATARALREESLSVFHAIGDLWGVGLALTGLGNVAFVQDDDAGACACYTEALSIQRKIGNAWHIAQILLMLGKSTWRQGDLQQARAVWEECLLQAGEVGAKEFLASARFMTGLVAQGTGDSQQAKAFFAESLALYQSIEYATGAAYALSGLAGVIEPPARAAQILGASAAVLDTARMPLNQIEHAHYERTVAALRTQLGEETFAAAWAEGQVTPLEEAVADALSSKLGIMRTPPAARSHLLPGVNAQALPQKANGSLAQR